MSAAVRGMAPGYVLTAPSSSSAVDHVIAWPSAPANDPSQRVHAANVGWIAGYECFPPYASFNSNHCIYTDMGSPKSGIRMWKVGYAWDANDRGFRSLTIT